MSEIKLQLYCQNIDCRYKGLLKWECGSCKSDLYLSSSGIVRCIKCGDTFKITSKNYFCNNCKKENKKDNSSKLRQFLDSIRVLGRIENLPPHWVSELVSNIIKEMNE